MTSINKQIKNAMLTAPYPYQYEDIRFLQSLDGQGFMFLEPGLGKSLISLGYLAINPTLRPAVVVCPASLKINWRKEAKIHINEDAVILSGKKPKPLSWNGLYVINYDVVSAWKQALIDKGMQVMILDEIQACKNAKSKRSKACKHLSMHIPHIIGLTGTPVTNRPADLFSLVDIVKPGLFPSWWSYIQRYCAMKRTPWGMDISGASHLDELHEKISPFCSRRKKVDVLKDLPEKQVIVAPVEISNRKEYNKAEADFLKWLERVKPEKLSTAMKAEALVKLATLRNLVVEGKMEALYEWIGNYLESGKKLIVFMCHTEPLHAIYKKYKKCAVMIDGSVSMKKRNEAVEKFQNDPKIRLFCGNIIAAGTGLTLTAADTVVFGELSYVPADHAQAQDRAHRIGQKSNVQVYYLIADNTLEEKVCDSLHAKMKIIDQILDGEITDSTGWNFKKELLCNLKKR